jgi:hypothetical protein
MNRTDSRVYQPYSFCPSRAFACAAIGCRGVGPRGKLGEVSRVSVPAARERPLTFNLQAPRARAFEAGFDVCVYSSIVINLKRVVLYYCFQFS